MGSDASGESLCELSGVTRDAQPIHRVYVDAFWMDATEATNAQFEKFIAATGYVTVAETRPTPAGATDSAEAEPSSRQSASECGRCSDIHRRP